MSRGVLLYHRDDYNKNIWFAHNLIDQGHLYGMDIKLVLTDEMILGIKETGAYVNLKEKELDKPDFVINRSRDSIIGAHFELMGCKVFNSSHVTEICNNKAKTHQIINGKGVQSVKTLLCNQKYFSIDQVDLPYPIILKSVSGHGGDEVYKLDSRDKLKDALSTLNTQEFILQEICSNPGKDIRVFVIGKEIIAAVKRYSNTSFKSNFSLGGESQRYELKQHEREIVQTIIHTLNFDFVGIDFILDKNDGFLFNEIEDVVGTRTLYKNYEIDIVKKYLEYIKTCL